MKVFIVQASLTAFTAGVCAAALLSGRGEPAAFLPVLAGMLGYWLPAPRPPPAPQRAESAESTAYRPDTPVTPPPSPRSHSLELDSAAATA